MKTIQELEQIRKKALDNINLRGDNKDKIRIVVGMATCGIAAGARKVLQVLVEEVSKRSLSNVTVSQAGCIGLCRLEPLVEVFMPDGNKYTYVNIDEKSAVRIVTEHVVNGKAASDLLISTDD